MDRGFAQHLRHIKKKIGEGAYAAGVYRFTLEDVVTGKKTIKYYHNVLTMDFFTMIMNNLTDPTPDNDMLFNYVALGDDDTLVTENDSVLGNEVYRNVTGSKTSAANIAYVVGFFTQTEVTGTFKEAGVVCDGTASADTGILASHVNIDITKTNVQKLTIDWMMTLLNA